MFVASVNCPQSTCGDSENSRRKPGGAAENCWSIKLLAQNELELGSKVRTLSPKVHQNKKIAARESGVLR